MFDGFYRNKRIFVTGHTGFKGAWLSLWLAELGAQVHGYSLEPPTQPNLFEEADVRTRLASHRIADVRDAETLANAIHVVKPDLVFHLAAQALVRRSYREPRQTYETNVMGTVNLLDAARRADSVRVCQIVTSDKCYENREWVYPYRENEPMGGADPYSSSKGCAELVVSAYRRSFFDPARIERHGISLASARAGNVIGGGDWAEDRIIPDCIRALSRGEVIELRNPNAIRPWQYVLEPLSGYLQLAAAQYADPAPFAEAWNFGPSTADQLNVSEVAQEVIRHWGSGQWRIIPSNAEHVASQAGSSHEANYLKLDTTKAASLLKWHSVLTVREAIAQTVWWYRQQAPGLGESDVAEMCAKQIRMYAERAAEQGLAWASSRKSPVSSRQRDLSSEIGQRV
jgi:CDP-glucose 4,6-dehydratase